MPPIYGDSFGDLSRNVQSAASARQAAFANALNTAVSALNAARSHATELARMDEQKRQFDQSMDVRVSEQADRQLESDRNFDLAKQNAGLAQDRFKLEKDYYDRTKDDLTPTQVRQKDLMLKQADLDASEGTFDSPDHVAKLYPSLSPAETAVMYQRSQDARRQITSDFVTARNAATVLNQQRLLNGRIYQIDDIAAKLKPETGVTLNPWGWSRNSENSDAVASLTQEKQRLGRQMQSIQPIADALTKDKNVQGLITFDAKTERYVPAVQPPRWMTTPAPGSKAPAAAAPAAAPAQPQAPVAAGPKYKPEFYNRVNQLIAAGTDPRTAKLQAIRESVSAMP